MSFSGMDSGRRLENVQGANCVAACRIAAVDRSRRPALDSRRQRMDKARMRRRMLPTPPPLLLVAVEAAALADARCRVAVDFERRRDNCNLCQAMRARADHRANIVRAKNKSRARTHTQC